MAQNAQKKVLRTLFVALVMGLIILGLKAWAYYLSDSLALKSDALESIVNIVATAFAIISAYYAHLPADEDHPFGHGKIEYFSSGFEGGMVFFAGLAIGYDAVKSFYLPHTLVQLEWGIALNLFAGALNGLVGYYLRTKARTLNSMILEGEAEHILSDFKTTLVLAVSMGVVYFTKWSWLDGLLALLLGLQLCYAGIQLVIKSGRYLLDSEDEEMVKHFTDEFNRYDDASIIDLHSLRTVRRGPSTHVHMHVTLPRYYDLTTSHDRLRRFEFYLARNLKGAGEFHSHIDPCDSSLCKACGMMDCPVRSAQRSDFTEASVAQVTERGPVHQWQEEEETEASRQS